MEYFDSPEKVGLVYDLLHPVPLINETGTSFNKSTPGTSQHSLATAMETAITQTFVRITRPAWSIYPRVQPNVERRLTNLPLPQPSR